MTAKGKTASLITWTSGMIAGLVVLLFPAGYFILSYQSLAGSLRAETEVNAGLLNRFITMNPDFWEFEDTRLVESLSHRPGGNRGEIRRVFNKNNQVVLELADDVSPPLINR